MDFNNRRNDDATENPARNQTKSKFLREHLRSYTSNTSLHALQYFGESGLYVVERIFWLIMVIASVTCCSLLIKNLWNKWEQSPVIVSFAETMTPVWKVPFPAITICPKNKILREKYDFNSKESSFSDLGDAEKQKLADISMICEPPYEKPDFAEYTNSTAVENIKSTESFKEETKLSSALAGGVRLEPATLNIKLVAPSLDIVMLECSWREGTTTPCEKLFFPVITNKGLCFTFNSLSADEVYRNENIQHEYAYSEENQTSIRWSPENGYDAKSSMDVYPRRGRNFGAGYDLIIHLSENRTNLSPLCDGLVRGFEILLHNPAEKPRLSQYFVEVRPGEEKKVAIKVNIETTAESLRNYKPSVRQCYFPTERYLRYFKIYTQKNCEMECRANFTYAMCDCVAFYMPFNDSTRICSTMKEECVNQAKEALADSLLEGLDDPIENVDDTNSKDKGEELYRIARSCRCLPTCTSASYEADTSSSKIDVVNFVKSINFNDTELLSQFKLSRVSFFFKDSQFISMRRSELYGPTDFLANCGGLLGLFHGFSVLSLIEIIYYMTLRLVCDIRRARTSKRNAEHNKLI